MLLQEQCQRSRSVPFSTQIHLHVVGPGDVIFVLLGNSSERQARQMSVDGLGRMVSSVLCVSPVKVYANAEIVIPDIVMSCTDLE